MRLATFNIQGGRGAAGGRWAGAPVDATVVRTLGAAVADLNLDVVAFQEVDHLQARSARVDQAAVLAAALGAADYRFVPHIAGRADGMRMPARRMFRAGPGYGNAIVSRLPVRSWHAMRMPRHLPEITFAGAGRTRRERLRIYDATRSLIACTLRVGGTDLSVASFHAPPTATRSAEQQVVAVQAIGRLPGTPFLAGDFNATPDVVARTLPWRSLVTAPTFPNPGPRNQIDYLLARDQHRVLAGGVENFEFSDHCLMWAEVEV